MNAIVKYEPKHEIHFYDGSTLYIDSSRKDAFFKAMEEMKFVRIGEWLYATSSIKSVLPAGNNVSIVESLLEGKSEDVKERVRQVIRQRRQDGMPISEAIILNIIEKMENFA